MDSWPWNFVSFLQPGHDFDRGDRIVLSCASKESRARIPDLCRGRKILFGNISVQSSREQVRFLLVPERDCLDTGAAYCQEQVDSDVLQHRRLGGIAHHFAAVQFLNKQVVESVGSLRERQIHEFTFVQTQLVALSRYSLRIPDPKPGCLSYAARRSYRLGLPIVVRLCKLLRDLEVHFG